MTPFIEDKEIILPRSNILSVDKYAQGVELGIDNLNYSNVGKIHSGYGGGVVEQLSFGASTEVKEDTLFKEQNSIHGYVFNTT